MHEVMDRPYLSIEAAEEALSVKRSTIYKLIDSGDLLRVKIGSNAYVTSESINAFVGRILADAKAGARQ